MRTNRRTTGAGLVFLVSGVLPMAATAQADTSPPPLPLPVLATCEVPDSVDARLERISRRVGGEVGFAAIHVESGTRLLFNADERYPMASVSKVPMALEYLRRVDAGEIDPARRIRVPITDFRPGSSPLASWSGGRAVHITVDSLFGLMLGASDNSATDVILNMSGGPAAATRHLRDLGVTGVTVDRSEARTFADLSGLPDTIPETELYRYQYFRMRDALPQAHRDSAREAYGSDQRDTATPTAMAELLLRIHAGEGLTHASRERLLDIMTGTRTGARRLKALLPGDTPVAHKTGTMAGAVNDVGIVSLPNGDHLIVAAFVNTLRSSTWRRERAIAEMTRTAYELFASYPVSVASADLLTVDRHVGADRPIGSCLSGP